MKKKNIFFNDVFKILNLYVCKKYIFEYKNCYNNKNILNWSRKQKRREMYQMYIIEECVCSI